MPSIYKNKNTNKWDFIFDYYLGGKRKQVRRRGFKTKREANDKLTELQNEVQQEEYVEPSKMTVSEYMREWLESREGKVESVTLYNHGCYIRNHIDPNLGEYKLQELNPIVCQKFIDGMSKNGYAYNTIERVVTILKIALDRAVHFKISKTQYAFD